jgi:hypothetical protein
MEQLQLLDVERERVSLPQEHRDELIRRMAEAIVIVFKAGRREGHDPSQDPS